MSFNFKKKFGQNFLQDKQSIQNIVDSINATPDDLIIEIGPGGGALTRRLVKKESYMIAYEIDTDTKEFLSELESDKFHVIYDDFLNRDITNDIKDIKFNNLYIIGNLPYYITTPIITKIIESNIDVKEMVFMVQKEVADRFSAKPSTKDYGSITVFLNYYFDIKKLFIVGKNKFKPVPNVDSAVIKLSKKDSILPVDINKFSKFVKASFQFKRKNLRNNLSSYDKEKINAILNEYGYSLDNRAEDLDYDIFVDIVNRL